MVHLDQMILWMAAYLTQTTIKKIGEQWQLDEDLGLRQLYCMDLNKNPIKYKTSKHFEIVRKIQHCMDIVILRILYL